MSTIKIGDIPYQIVDWYVPPIDGYQRFAIVWQEQDSHNKKPIIRHVLSPLFEAEDQHGRAWALRRFKEQIEQQMNRTGIFQKWHTPKLSTKNENT